MENCIPKYWERERESKKAFPTFGNGNGNEKLIPKLWEFRIPENGREREFPLTPAPGLMMSTFQRVGMWVCVKSMIDIFWDEQLYKMESVAIYSF